MEDFIAQMEEEYGQASPLTVSCGKIPNYLGMTLDFTLLAFSKKGIKINLLSELNLKVFSFTSIPCLWDQCTTQGILTPPAELISGWGR